MSASGTTVPLPLLLLPPHPAATMALNAEMTIALACMWSTHCKSSTMARSTIAKANSTQCVLRRADCPLSRDKNVAVRDVRRSRLFAVVDVAEEARGPAVLGERHRRKDADADHALHIRARRDDHAARRPHQLRALELHVLPRIVEARLGLAERAQVRV